MSGAYLQVALSGQTIPLEKRWHSWVTKQTAEPGMVGQDCIPNTPQAEAGLLMELWGEGLAQAVLTTHPQ